MGISPSEYHRGRFAVQCLARLSQPTVFPAVTALSGGQGVGEDAGAQCQLYPPTYTFFSSSLVATLLPAGTPE